MIYSQPLRLVVSLSLAGLVAGCQCGSTDAETASTPAEPAPAVAAEATGEPAGGAGAGASAVAAGSGAAVPEQIAPGTFEEVAGSGVDHSDPVAVVQHVFDVARNGRIDTMRGLCDPINENDSDTRHMCTVSEESFTEFYALFNTATVTGPAVIEPDSMRAEVPVVFRGPAGPVSETFELIQRDGKWYLFGL